MFVTTPFSLLCCCCEWLVILVSVTHLLTKGACFDTSEMQRLCHSAALKFGGEHMELEAAKAAFS